MRYYAIGGGRPRFLSFLSSCVEGAPLLSNSYLVSASARASPVPSVVRGSFVVKFLSFYHVRNYWILQHS